jgi:O-antigen biosynthesis protein
MQQPSFSYGVLFLQPPDDGQRAAIQRLDVPPTEVVTHGAGTAAAIAAAPWWLVIEGDAIVEPAAPRRFSAATGDDASGVFSDFFEANLPLTTPHVVHTGAWSVERSRWQAYTGQMAWIRSDALDAVVGRERFSVHEALIAAAARGSISHIAQPLYTIMLDIVVDVTETETADQLQRAGVHFTLTDSRPPRSLDKWPTVSIIIPTRGGYGDVKGVNRRLIDVTLRSVLDTTAALEPQIVLVVDTDVPTDYVNPWRDELGDRLVVRETPPPFNFSHKINIGAEAATSDIIVMLNDDMEAITEYWLDNLVAVATEPDVGAVGAMLLLGEGTIQHAGHAFSADGPQLLDVGREHNEGPRRRNACDRDVTGVSAACLVQRREVWEQLGGLDPLLPVNFNDVDYCVRILNAGYRVVQCNTSVLYHFESQTKGDGAEVWEVERIRWRLVPDNWYTDDPFTPADAPPLMSFVPNMKRRVAKARRAMRAGGAKAVLQEWRNRGSYTTKPRAQS